MSTTMPTAESEVFNGITPRSDESVRSIVDVRSILELEPQLRSSQRPIAMGEPATKRKLVSDPMQQEDTCRNACSNVFATELLVAIRVELAALQTGIIDDITSKMQMRKITESTGFQTTSEAAFSSEMLRCGERMQVAMCDKPASSASSVSETLKNMTVVEPQQVCMEEIMLAPPEEVIAVQPEPNKSSIESNESKTKRSSTFAGSISFEEFEDPPYPFYWYTRGLRGVFGWDRIERIIVLWYSLQEPPRTGWLYRLQASTYFDVFFSVAIFGNFIFQIVRVNQSIEGSAEDFYMRIGDMIFGFIFAVECGIQIIASGWYYFVKQGMLWNWMDFCLVLMTIVDFFLLTGNGSNAGILRVIRFIRLIKMVRVVRVMLLFKTLRVMLDSLYVSFTSLFWSLVMLIAICCMFGLVFTQLVATRMMDGSLDNVGSVSLLSHFGTVQEAALTLFQSTTGGADWGEAYEMLAYIGNGSQYLFLFYVCFTQVAVLNIVTGVFVDSAFQAAKQSSDELAAQLQQEHCQSFKGLLSMVRQHIVTDGSDSFNLKDLEESLNDEAVRGFLATHGISIHDPRFLFQVLMPDPEMEKIGAVTFVTGCLALRGFPSTTDSQLISFQVSLSHKKLKKLESSMTSELDKLKETLLEVYATLKQIRRERGICHSPVKGTVL